MLLITRDTFRIQVFVHYLYKSRVHRDISSIQSSHKMKVIVIAIVVLLSVQVGHISWSVGPFVFGGYFLTRAHQPNTKTKKATFALLESCALAGCPPFGCPCTCSGIRYWPPNRPVPPGCQPARSCPLSKIACVNLAECTAEQRKTYVPKYWLP